MTITYHKDLIQGSDEWLQARLGILTASEMKHIITPKTLKLSAGSETHMYELISQRMTNYIEPSFIGYDMLRGMEDEPVARQIYSENVHEVEQCGFVTNDEFGFTIGYSPDGLVGNNGQIEAKSRDGKFQIRTFLSKKPDTDFFIQLQTGLIVTKREWVDFVQYSPVPEPETGIRETLNMIVIRVYPDATAQEAILEAASQFNKNMEEAIKTIKETQNSDEYKTFKVPFKKIQQEITIN